MHVFLQAQVFRIPLCCLHLQHAGGQAHLVSVELVFFDLEQLIRMQNFTRCEVLDVERPTLPEFLNAWLTCSRIFAYLGDAPRSVLQACRAEIVSSCNFGSAVHAQR